MCAARKAIHSVGESPTRGVAQLAAVVLSGVSKEVTRETEARTYKSRRPGRDIKAEVGGPGDERWMGPQHEVNTAASLFRPTQSSGNGVLSATVGMRVPSFYIGDEGQCGCGRSWACARNQPSGVGVAATSKGWMVKAGKGSHP